LIDVEVEVEEDDVEQNEKQDMGDAKEQKQDDSLTCFV
jgi:hypothetical protein